VTVPAGIEQPLDLCAPATTPGPGAAEDGRGGYGAPAAAGQPLVIVVYGEPAPQGSKRHVGNGVMIESSKKVKPWRQDVVTAALAAYYQDVTGEWLHSDARAPLDGPLAVRMTFTLRKPASAPKTRRTWPDRKPDLSKLVRSTEDALVTAGVIADDARIVDLVAAKRFPGEGLGSLTSTGVRIEIEQVTP
jgi:Holliday junction resolvase RusA-like endonuclease